MTTGSVFGVEGKVALVTGASSGLGRASANFLAKAGAKVVGLARRADALEAWRVEAGGQTAAIAADLGTMQDFEGLVADQCRVRLARRIFWSMLQASICASRRIR
jgi:NADP-dependent 3-hydroxy acid dehydrogenase YdfG